MRISIILCYLFLCLSCTREQESATEFHKPQTIAEKKLDEILKLDNNITESKNIHAYILQKSDRNLDLDDKYAALLSNNYVKACLKIENNSTNKACNENDTDGELCGLGYSPLTCSQDINENHLYRTIKETSYFAIIEYQAIGYDEEESFAVGTYKMIKQNNNWILDGVRCSKGENFNLND